MGKGSIGMKNRKGFQQCAGSLHCFFYLLLIEVCALASHRLARTGDGDDGVYLLAFS